MPQRNASDWFQIEFRRGRGPASPAVPTGDTVPAPAASNSPYVVVCGLEAMSWIIRRSETLVDSQHCLTLTVFQ